MAEISISGQGAGGTCHRVRLLQVDRMDGDTYARLNERHRKGTAQSGGPSDYTVRAHHPGPALLHFCQRMVDADGLSTAKVARVLGVKPSQVGKFFAMMN